MDFRGGGGIGKIAGEKAGELVEQTVNKIVSGSGGKDGGKAQKPKEGEKEKGGGGVDIGNLLSFDGGQTAKQEGNNKGLDVKNLAGGLFK